MFVSLDIILILVVGLYIVSPIVYFTEEEYTGLRKKALFSMVVLLPIILVISFKLIIDNAAEVIIEALK